MTTETCVVRAPADCDAPMEFTEPFRLASSGGSGLGVQVLLSPQSRYIAVSECNAPTRRIGPSVQDLTLTWTVRIVDTETLAPVGEYLLQLPLSSPARSGMSSQRRDNGSSGGKAAANPTARQFSMARDRDTGEDVAGRGTNNGVIGPTVCMEWSARDELLAVWPTSTTHIFILSPTRSTNRPLLCINEQGAVGVAAIKWTPDGTGLLVTLRYGMGIKYWRLDCAHPVHLFPYPKATEGSPPAVFSSDGRYMAILHRRDGADHIAVYARIAGQDASDGDWQVVHWLNVPDDANLDGISFARGMGALLESAQSAPFLYAWESLSKFRFLVYGPDGEVKTRVEPGDLLAGTSDGPVADFDKSFCTFGITKWHWCANGRIAAFSDAQENVYLWNAVIHKLIGQIALQIDSLKAQNPIVFKEQPLRDPDSPMSRVKYDASYVFPMQSQILSPAVKTGDAHLRYALSSDGEFLAMHHSGKYPTCLWIFDLKCFRLKALLVQLKPIIDFSWHPTEALLALCINSDHVYFWQESGTHCVPYPSSDFGVKSVQWHVNRRTMLLVGPEAYCLGIPDILAEPDVVLESTDSFTF